MIHKQRYYQVEIKKAVDEFGSEYYLVAADSVEEATALVRREFPNQELICLKMESLYSGIVLEGNGGK